jgi:hypothetical protein
MNIITSVASGAALAVCSALAQWSEAPTTRNARRHFCHDLGCGFKNSRNRKVVASGEIREQYHFAPVPYRREPCPLPHLFNHFRTRIAETILPLPRWRDSTVRFSELPPWKFPRRSPDEMFNVSDASVIRSRCRADRAAAMPRPTEADPVWKDPATQPVDFITQYLVLMDDELRDKMSVASQCRVYSAEEWATASRWSSALFSSVKSEALTLRGSDVTLDEKHQFDMWPYFTVPYGHNKQHDLTIRPLTLQEKESGFSVMTTLANKLSKIKELKRIINARVASARAYQAAELVLRLYRFEGRRISPTYLRAARIVYQAVSQDLHLRDLENLDLRLAELQKRWKRMEPLQDLIRIVPFMLAPGITSDDAEAKFDRSASTLRGRLAGALKQLEERFGRYCNELQYPRQSGATAGYNGIKGRAPAGPADWLLSPAERAALVTEYLAKADACRAEPLSKDYCLIAEYLRRGGRIFADKRAVVGSAPFSPDHRRNETVLEEGFTGSPYRETGLDPSEIFKRGLKPRRLSDNIEYDVDVGLRHGLADTDAPAAIEDDDAPISDTRKPDNDLYMSDISPFLPQNGTVHTDDEDRLHEE